MKTLCGQDDCQTFTSSGQKLTALLSLRAPKAFGAWQSHMRLLRRFAPRNDVLPKITKVASKTRKFGSEYLRKGFTLIELMIVIVILGILATIVVPRFMGREEQARRIAAKVQIKNFETALAMFKLDNGFYPDTEQGLQALVEKPAGGRVPGNWKQYLPKVPKDPWASDYVYICPGLDGRDYDIISFGQDGEEGGEENNADIKN